MSQPGRAPLAGYRVAVTSARRADQLWALLRGQGATVFAAPAIVLSNLPDDHDLHRQTEALIAHPPDILIATTAIGFCRWIAAADGWGLAGELIAALSKARIVSRGPKATGALRAAGLPEAWSPQSESSRELVRHLLESGIDGRRVAVQLHGTVDNWDPVPEMLDELRVAGADVVPVRVYRWRAASSSNEFDRLVTRIARRQFDAVAFTSAPAAVATLLRADELGVTDDLVAALRSDVRAMCVGPTAAAPLARLGIPTTSPQRARLGALARHIADELPLRTCTVHAAGHRIEIRGGHALVDGVVRPLSPGGLAILRALAQHPGAVVARHDLLRVLPRNGSGDHAVEAAVLRIRNALGNKNIVATVVKRGYRLAIDEHPEAL
ncbi:MAG TPA: uroporphyrinogen-III synthase [Mycobacterium sp.]|nr:uroporphyrinogen-III synthase [Mycobacterium sp.]